MPLTKQYLKYGQCGVFNIVAGSKSNVVFLSKDLVAVGACERVFVWDIRKGEKIKELMCESQQSEVSVLESSQDQQYMAVGYENGDIIVFDASGGNVLVTFKGHKSAVTTLAFDVSGTRLASGSKDTNVIVWDIVNESGLFRLKGHKGNVTKVHFCRRVNIIISSSKDTFIKFWDLDTQHCFKTLVGHRSEVWTFVLLKDDTQLITGPSESHLKVWQLNWQVNDEPKTKKVNIVPAINEKNEDEEEDSILECVEKGSLVCRIKNRVVTLAVDSQEKILTVHGSDSYADLFYITSETELSKRLKKKQKKLKRSHQEDTEEKLATISLEDQYMKLGRIKFSAKLSHVQILVSQDHQAKVLALLANNSLQVAAFEVKKPNKNDLDFSLTHPSLPGHMTDVRTVAFSSDNTCCVSGSAEQVCIWNRTSQQCIRSMPCDYALCSLFTPGDRHVIIGTKAGKLQIFDIASSVLLEEVAEAHQGAIWSLCLLPNKRGIVSGGADHNVKFWEFELKKHELFTASVLSISQKKTLKMSEDVLSVKVTNNARLLCVSLLDNTVKVFFVDTLKFFLSLYGHKLPVLCMDTSDDSTLLASGSADRNIKLWGLDFGDCHKSLFAHDDSVMCLRFVPKTHMFFSGGKDGFLKLWDADNFQMITKLKGHHGSIWCLAISPNGKHVLTGSHDKSIRLWGKTSEPLILEEEREMEREKEFEEDEKQTDTVIPGETNTETGLAARKTPETLMATDKIIEAIDTYKEENEKEAQYKAECKVLGKELPKPQVNPLLMAYRATSPSQYVFEIFKRIRASEMEKALLMLPFSYACDLLRLLNEWIQLGWDIDNSLKCLLFLLRIYHGQITQNTGLLELVNDIRVNAVSKVKERKDMVGFNLSGLHFLKRTLEEKKEAILFKDATDQFRSKKKQRKRKQATVLSMTS